MNRFLKRELIWRDFIMQIDFALILSAGKGTRMGEVGKQIPKPLWPIYSKTLLELQVNYCREMGIKKIYINTFYLGEEIEKFLQSNNKFKDVIVLKEDPLLDSGGAVHNLASQKEINYKGNALLINADQFLLFDPLFFKKALSMLEKSRAVLFGINVDKASHYNETVIKDEKLCEITKPHGDRDFITYSGIGILKLDGLKRVPGISRFFESVADYKNEEILFLTPQNYEYWDFGTLDIYKENIFKLYEFEKRSIESQMINYLKKHDSFDHLDNFVRISDSAICLDNNGVFEAKALTFNKRFYFN